VVAGCFGVAMVAASTSPAIRINNAAYDWIFSHRALESWAPESVVVAIDEETLSAGHGMPNIRSILSEVLDKIKDAHPRAVASDVILHDEVGEVVDKRLAASLRAIPNLVLPCELVGDHWEDPAPIFKELAVGLGHVHLDINRSDGVIRQIPLEKVAKGDTRWALALEAFRVSRGDRLPPIQSPDDVETAGVRIPAARAAGERPMLIRYLRDGIPVVPGLAIDRFREMLRGKTVFLGITALSAAHDRPVNPFGEEVPGVAIHAQAFETLAHGRFITHARDGTVLMVCSLIAILAGLIFMVRSGWQAYTLGALLIGAAFWLPFPLMRNDIDFPYVAPVAVAWMATMGASVYQHFFVRRKLRRTESEKTRYQQAIHWAAHEMRSPLTAIQGSSEIMTRYSLPEAKRGELSAMINSESKRLARMIQTFLDVERLADGHMELKREPFAAADLVTTCIMRATPIADHKKSRIFLDNSVDGVIVGDRELMEYALYNLLTNAVKYSPPESEVHVATEFSTGKSSSDEPGELRIHVRDRGIGMDSKELKSIFQKFYRTKRAEASGEAGTGIGLSIVDQIVSHHGGRVEVTSEPQKGSCFTMIIAASESAAISPNGKTAEKTADRRG
jgi:signal transduction histidine kinase